jgi:hypothetical protein
MTRGLWAGGSGPGRCDADLVRGIARGQWSRDWLVVRSLRGIVWRIRGEVQKLDAFAAVQGMYSGGLTKK